MAGFLSLIFSSSREAGLGCRCNTSLKGSFQTVFKMMSGEGWCLLKFSQPWVCPRFESQRLFFEALVVGPFHICYCSWTGLDLPSRPRPVLLWFGVKSSSFKTGLEGWGGGRGGQDPGHMRFLLAPEAAGVLIMLRRLRRRVSLCPPFPLSAPRAP